MPQVDPSNNPYTELDLLRGRVDRHLALLEKQTTILEQLQESVSILRARLDRIEHGQLPSQLERQLFSTALYVDGREERMPVTPPSVPLC